MINIDVTRLAAGFGANANEDVVGTQRERKQRKQEPQRKTRMLTGKEVGPRTRGTKIKQSGNKAKIRTPKRDKIRNKVKQRGNEAGTRYKVGQEWEQNGNKVGTRTPKRDKHGNKVEHPMWDKNGILIPLREYYSHNFVPLWGSNFHFVSTFPFLFKIWDSCSYFIPLWSGFAPILVLL